MLTELNSEYFTDIEPDSPQAETIVASKDTDRKATLQYLNTLHPSGRASFRLIKSKKLTGGEKDVVKGLPNLAFNEPQALAELESRNREGFDIYVMVNPGKAINNDSVEGFSCLFVDVDKPEQFNQAAFELLPRPSITVNSKAGNHYYWLIETEPKEAQDQWIEAENALVKTLGADKWAKNLCRVLRVPGFAHRKGDMTSGFIVGCSVADQPLYKLSDLSEAIKRTSKQAPPQASPEQALGFVDWLKAQGKTAQEVRAREITEWASTLEAGSRNDLITKAAWILGRYGRLEQPQTLEALMSGYSASGGTDESKTLKDITRQFEKGFAAADKPSSVNPDIAGMLPRNESGDIKKSKALLEFEILDKLGVKDKVAFDTKSLRLMYEGKPSISTKSIYQHFRLDNGWAPTYETFDNYVKGFGMNNLTNQWSKLVESVPELDVNSPEFKFYDENLLPELLNISNEHEHGTFYRRALLVWLMQMVQRALTPGCPGRFCLVLKDVANQGVKRQKKGKSTWFKYIAHSWPGSAYQFAGGKSAASINPKDDQTLQSINRAAVYVAEELDGLTRKAHASEIKELISATQYFFRPKYWESEVVFESSTIWGATTNAEQFLTDDTNTRFIVIEIDDLRPVLNSIKDNWSIIIGYVKAKISNGEPPEFTEAEEAYQDMLNNDSAVESEYSELVIKFIDALEDCYTLQRVKDGNSYVEGSDYYAFTADEVYSILTSSYMLELKSLPGHERSRLITEFKRNGWDTVQIRDGKDSKGKARRPRVLAPIEVIQDSSKKIRHASLEKQSEAHKAFSRATKVSTPNG